ncbi:MAG: pyrimidine-nucleoside phosphorylase, partial [Clostridia bacterium]|nr:pyrimidine-nucleoside phosphorylase [Clostridia bacterium]
MRMYDIIQKKRDGGHLSKEEIEFFVKEYTAENIPDYQASALMMAVYFQGMSDEETVWLTEAMASSGDQLDLSCFGKLSVDKHSTGGVGDKTSLIVGPIVAACGAKVSKMSGRGLGHTGGTVDKLESIPGYNTTLSGKDFLDQVDHVGLSIIGQSGNLTPADKKLYALRDVTATVDSIPLITSSIMSKKIAAGSHNIVLDVKVGSGAFMKTPEEAYKLASSMVEIGKKCGRNMAALITNMDVPLGYAVGNALEVKEAISVLSRKDTGDLWEICKALSSQMIALAFDVSFDRAEHKVMEVVRSGAALQKMKEWIAAQGGDASYVEHPEQFDIAKNSFEVLADRDGYILSVDAQQIGLCSVQLGAGRATKTDAIDHSAGIVLEAKLGQRVKKGDRLCTLFTNRSALEDCETS